MGFEEEKLNMFFKDKKEDKVYLVLNNNPVLWVTFLPGLGSTSTKYVQIFLTLVFLLLHRNRPEGHYTQVFI